MKVHLGCLLAAVVGLWFYGDAAAGLMRAWANQDRGRIVLYGTVTIIDAVIAGICWWAAFDQGEDEQEPA